MTTILNGPNTSNSDLSGSKPTKSYSDKNHRSKTLQDQVNDLAVSFEKDKIVENDALKNFVLEHSGALIAFNEKLALEIIKKNPSWLKPKLDELKRKRYRP